MSYVGSLMGVTFEVDKSTLHQTDYVRIYIVAKNVSKIPETVVGAILSFMYNFAYEREVEMSSKVEGATIKIHNGKVGD
jgi:hypothetical protein